MQLDLFRKPASVLVSFDSKRVAPARPHLDSSVPMLLRDMHTMVTVCGPRFLRAVLSLLLVGISAASAQIGMIIRILFLTPPFPTPQRFTIPPLPPYPFFPI